ncbi:hypothetical protein [Polymorphobacter megasporae]|uniref:hypothetical protein n=1 Tax=Glacieibacterium megasporae TaxID=2835787 RepID=UPI001C1E66AF|nr:hypothetical protein [Polymorphobacter megasporae]UAJ11274.1 hypothetical protein KTC28_06120 [Polymorphobacter megasporae]
MRSLDDQYHPADVLTFLGLTRGVRVFIVEHDPGYFGEIVGAAVGPGGRVTELVRRAVIQDAVARSRLSDAIGRAPSLALLAAEPSTVRLAPGSLDFVLLHLAYEQLPSDAAAPGASNPGVSAFLNKLFIALRPGGIVGVVEPSVDAGGAGRDSASVKRDFQQAGFVLDAAGRMRGEEDDTGLGQPQAATAGSAPGNFILKFRKPE